LLPKSYFDNNLFNRYQIDFNKEPINKETLKELIRAENGSVLIILNTIDDTKELYKLLLEEFDKEELLLLNTHLTPRHRKIKIYLAKRRLRQNKRVIVVSTQLIEAGVDIDFPVVFRDFTTIASIVQSAGRCNRNGKLGSMGQVRLIKLVKNGKERSKLIFRGKDEELINLTKRSLIGCKYQEKELLNVQEDFFKHIQSELNFAKHSQTSPKLEFDFLKDIHECMYDKIGKFQLIDKQLFGKENSYYVAWNNQDDNFEVLLKKQEELNILFRAHADKSVIRTKKKSIERQLKKMAGQIVQVRSNQKEIRPLPSDERNYFDLGKIDSTSYSFEYGVDIEGINCIL